MTSRLARRLAGFCVLLLLPAACSLLGINETAEPGQPAAATALPSATAEAFPFATPEVPAALIVWLPERFAQSDLLRARLDEFAAAHPGLSIDLRIKSEQGPAGMLESLRAAGQAAPSALPDLALLSRADLEAAAGQGRLFSVGRWASALEDPDWFEYARALARIGEAVYGLPFAGDAPVLAYRPGAGVPAAFEWAALRAGGSRLVFPADDPGAAFTLSLYLSANPAPGLPLDPQALARALSEPRDWQAQNLLVADSIRFSLDEEAWAAFAEGRAALIVTRSARVLSGSDPDLSLVPLPGLDGVPAALADGWLWALPGADESRRAAAIELAEFLTEPEFLARWSEPAGALPVRSSALAAWADETRRSAAAAVVQSARGPSAQAAQIAPLVRQALLAVLAGEADPAGAAQSAAERIK